MTADFQLDEETNQPKVKDGANALIGGMIMNVTVKQTKTNKMMAFLTLEDLIGTVEVIVFPRDYQIYRAFMEEDRKVFVRGRVSSEDDRPARLICERIWPIEEQEAVPAAESDARELWVQFSDRQDYAEKESQLFDILRESEGEDYVVLFLRSERAVRHLGENWTIDADEALIGQLQQIFGKENVRFAKNKNVQFAKNRR